MRFKVHKSLNTRPRTRSVVKNVIHKKKKCSCVLCRKSVFTKLKTKKEFSRRTMNPCKGGKCFKSTISPSLCAREILDMPLAPPPALPGAGGEGGALPPPCGRPGMAGDHGCCGDPPGVTFHPPPHLPSLALESQPLAELFPPHSGVQRNRRPVIYRGLIWALS